MTIEAPTDGEIFLAYLEQVVGPQLQRGDVVVMDNLAAHKIDGVRALIADRGAQLLYLPPYSPDFNPIEKCWAKIKQLFTRSQGPLVTGPGDGHRPGARCRDAPKHPGLFPPLRLCLMKTMKMV